MNPFRLCFLHLLVASYLISLVNTGLCQQSIILLEPEKDACIYIEQTEDGLEKSNGLGKEFLIGRTNAANATTLRRALIQFDLTSIPEGATVLSANLHLHLNKAATTDSSNISIYRLLQDWKEGSSIPASVGNGIAANPGDVTWRYTDFDSIEWEIPGGFYDSIPVMSQTIDKGPGRKTWGELASEVQFMLDHPELNFGWLLKDNEDTMGSIRRFSTKDDSINQPILEVEYMMTTNIENNSKELEILGPYPNPTKSQASIEILSKKQSKVKLMLLDAVGRILITKESNLKSGIREVFQIDISDKTKGIYFIQVHYLQGAWTKKLIIH